VEPSAGQGSPVYARRTLDPEAAEHDEGQGWPPVRVAAVLVADDPQNCEAISKTWACPSGSTQCGYSPEEVKRSRWTRDFDGPGPASWC
jgi:hypothetical protein